MAQAQQQVAVAAGRVRAAVAALEAWKPLAAAASRAGAAISSQ
jgi:hypothetical protein